MRWCPPSATSCWPSWAGTPGGRLTWQPDPAAVPANGTASLSPFCWFLNRRGLADENGAAQAGAAGPAGAAAPAAPPAVPDQDALIALISERTGYPVDLIEPDLDLEAELSIDSIKRAEIAGEVAASLGMSAESDTDAARFEELVKLRTVRSIVEWLHQMAAQDGQDAAGGGATGGSTTGDGATAIDTTAAPEQAALAEAPPGQATLTGVTPLRLLPQAASVPRAEEPQSSLAGARFLLTGPGEVTDQLAARLRECGAEARTTTRQVVAVDDVRGADGLILLDGLAPPTGPLPPALFPLARMALSGGARKDGPDSGGPDQPASPRWLLAAGAAGSSAAAGLGGLFRAIHTEYPDHRVRYVQLDPAAPAGDIAARLLGELLCTDSEPVVSYAQGARQRTELIPVPLSALARRGAGPAADGSAEAQALGLSSDSVVVLIGGARGITAVFARQLAAASRCRLELAGRTQLAAAPPDDDLAAAPDAVALRAALARRGMRKPAEIERATRDILARREVEATIAELQALGSRVRYHCGDAGDEEAISQVLKLARQEHGRIDGVVYAAGIIEDRLIADKNPESFTRVFHTKVAGAQIVLEALAEQQCDPGFVVLYGSVAAAFGSRGQADYAAANDALEITGQAGPRPPGGAASPSTGGRGRRLAPTRAWSPGNWAGSTAGAGSA